MLSATLRRWTLAGYCMASAICLVVGLFLVPNIVLVDRLECRLDEVCVPPKTPGMIWAILPLPLAWLTLGTACLVVLANLVVTGVSMLSRGGVPRWLRLTYLVGDICLTGVLAVDVLSMILGLLPGPGVLFVLAGLLLMALAWWCMRSGSPRLAAAGGVAIGGGSAA